MTAIAGVGSRETPSAVLVEMEAIGRWCALHGVVVRSGHADGADYAFEKGARAACELHLPWEGYNDDLPRLTKRVFIWPGPSRVLDALVRELHPASEVLTRGSFSLHRRNGAIVMGDSALSDPAAAVVCWTKDGGPTGGTGQAIRVAEKFRVPVLNMHDPEWATAEPVIGFLAGRVLRLRGR